MLGDHVRMEAYKRAIHEVVKQGDVVADIGTGSGILASFAVQAGARKVYAIERDGIIEEAERLAKVSGLEKKIIFLKGRSDRVEIPEKVDVITSELIGFFGLEENLHQFKINARDRFLKPGGRLVPEWLELCLVPVESKALWEKNVGLWSKNDDGLDLSPVRHYAVSQRYVTDCSTDTLQLAAPFVTSRIDFYGIKEIPFVFQGEFLIKESEKLHGVVGYFRAGLSSSVVLSTSPEEPITHWAQTFFPMEETVSVREGDEVSCTIKAIPQMDTVFWEWRTHVYRKGEKIAGFNQSNLKLTKEELTMGRAGFRPALSEDGKMLRRVLGLCDGKKSMGEISEKMMEDYPKEYVNSREAMQKIVGILRSMVKTEG